MTTQDVTFFVACPKFPWQACGPVASGRCGRITAAYPENSELIFAQIKAFGVPEFRSSKYHPFPLHVCKTRRVIPRQLRAPSRNSDLGEELAVSDVSGHFTYTLFARLCYRRDASAATV
jgi:hypothetical protein